MTRARARRVLDALGSAVCDHVLSPVLAHAETVLAAVPAPGLALCDLCDGDLRQAWRNLRTGEWSPLWRAQ